MLTRDQQQFLPHYTNAAAVLDSDEGIERATSIAGRFGSDVAYQTTTSGIGYRWDEEKDPGDMFTMTGLITWPQLRAHREAQPQAARDRLRRAVDCAGTAAEWSYDHTAPDEMQSEFGRYSALASHYWPRCVPCHRVMDIALLNGDRDHITD